MEFLFPPSSPDYPAIHNPERIGSSLPVLFPSWLRTGCASPLPPPPIPPAPHRPGDHRITEITGSESGAAPGPQLRRALASWSRIWARSDATDDRSPPKQTSHGRTSASASPPPLTNALKILCGDAFIWYLRETEEQIIFRYFKYQLNGLLIPN